MKTGRIVGWDVEQYKEKWINYCKSIDFRYIYPLLDNFVKEKIEMLNNYYGINITEFIN